MSGAKGRTKPPVDAEAMRAVVLRLLGPDAELPTYEEAHDLILELRGHVMLLIPEVEQRAERLPRDDVPRACALACLGEARRRLSVEAGPGLPAAVAHSQRLARSVNALLDHVTNLSSGVPELGCPTSAVALGEGTKTRQGPA
ncbi:DUF6415 family natural product biosynthesis protein [Streptomyces sp. NPDC059909]|uniref:DUF6415 family natural product biosynthesis protein n=1 Tax=Streptomyces sp. NPDC059909 TaxID=3346998 RepID=UPI00364AEB99